MDRPQTKSGAIFWSDWGPESLEPEQISDGFTTEDYITFAARAAGHEVYTDVPYRWDQFSYTEKLALAGCIKCIVLMHPTELARLGPEMIAAINRMAMELDAEVRR